MIILPKRSSVDIVEVDKLRCFTYISTHLCVQDMAITLQTANVRTKSLCVCCCCVLRYVLLQTRATNLHISQSPDILSHQSTKKEITKTSSFEEKYLNTTLTRLNSGSCFLKEECSSVQCGSLPQTVSIDFFLLPNT